MPTWVTLRLCVLVALSTLLGCRSPLPDLDDAHRDLSDALPAFVGAEGFGTDTTGGRGGDVLVVTTLDADGAGSLAEALAHPAPRTVVFAVSGTIWLAANLVIDQPYLTLAGQTAPGDGVTLAGAGLSIRTHDVVVQHLRIRVGDGEGHNPEDRDAVQLIGVDDGSVEVARVVIDHCSLSWATDEIASTWYPGVHDVTFSHNLFGEGLSNSLHPEGEHSKALLIGDSSRRISVVRNVFVHNVDRNPVVGGDATAHIVNNLIYNPGQFAIALYQGAGWGPSLAAVEGNVMIAGADTEDWTRALRVTADADAQSRVYAVDTGTVESDHDGVLTDERVVSATPTSVWAAADVEARLLDDVGAVPLRRDAVDLRLIADVQNRTGRVIDSQDDVGGWPDLAEVSSDPVERGMPSDASVDDNDDGYTNLEHWLHALDAAARPSPTM